MDELTMRSTSRASAAVSDIILRHTSTTRLVFRPIIVDNTAHPEAAAEGAFVFQRKGPNEAWEDIPVEPLSRLKKGDAYKLSLDSAETKTLFDGLQALYEIHASSGVPRGQARFVRVRGALEQLASLAEPDLRAFLEANRAVGSPLVERLLAWATDANQVRDVVQILESLGPSALADLGAAVSLGSLREGLQLWRSNTSNADEDFWQDVLSKRSYLLEQLFAWPCTVIKEKAYIGGKSVHNTGGHLVDFLVRNHLTSSAALVEIKTPMTPLTGSDYRDGIPNISGQLTGSVIQALTYKASLIEHHRGIRGEDSTYAVFDPPCIVIVGNSATLPTTEKRRSFELFRRQLSGVEVVTYDELFGRVERLAALLAPTSRAIPDADSDENPF